jgi:Glycine/D-amino acid oxidases (deaminating)
MKVIVLGAGVIGTTTAYYLAKAGHQVTVIEREAGPALETSFANAGQISPGYSTPWAAPDIPMKVAKWMFMRHAPLVIRPGAAVKAAPWLLAMLRNCTKARYVVNKGRMVRLAEYSRDCLRQLRADTGIEYDHRSLGTLQLFRTEKQVDDVAKDLRVLEADGVPFEMLDRNGCVRVEPGLAGSRDKIVGGLRLPDDETGDCFKFTNALAEIARGLGVEFRTEVTIERLATEGGRIRSVVTSAGEFEADAFVAALGSYTPAMLKTLGLRIPVIPVKGYSITVPIVDEAKAPVSTVMDETYKTGITRLGDRIRVGGTAEIAGFNLDLPRNRRETLELSVNDLFTGAGDLSQAQFWTGLRPMTPDSTPIVGGTTRYPNLYINTGHGTLGWTMACGSGRVLADIISGIKPEIETADLALSRYGA